MAKKRYIVHVDMDAFFAAVEQRDNPSIRGKPVIVGADPKKGRGRGVVSACSYEARRFGIHSAMPISIAYQKYPHAIFLRPDMEKYSRISRQIYDILYNFTPEIEPVSIDEAFLDISGSYHLFGTPRQTSLLIKSKIKDETRLTASIGLAPTKMAAKIASDLGKPDGFLEVTEEKLLDFLWPLDVGRIWGLGKKTEAVLNDAGAKTIGDLARADVKELIDIFGKNGARLWQLANGIDDGAVQAETEAKSISSEITFDKDTLDKDIIKGTLMSLCEKVSLRLREEGLKGRTVTLKIRLEDFHTYTRDMTLSEATNFADILYGHVKHLYENFDAKDKKVRLVGVKVSNLFTVTYKDSLFSEYANQKREEIHKAIDKIRGKFGDGLIHRASSKYFNE
jgi:nucleotidyltransferase/DNA polymerase involved in DNA repair